MGPFNLQGLVLFALYVAGVAGAVLVALLMRRVTRRTSYHPLLMELPEYHWPNLRNLLTGLWERTQIFLTRVGTIILALMVLMWFLASYPQPPAGATGPAIRYSFAGMMGSGLESLFKPLGFNWQISLALVPGIAAREVVVGALGTVYSLSASGAEVGGALRPMIASSWSLATALVAARLVRVRAAVPVDAGDRAARNQFLALSADDGRLPVRDRVRVCVRHLPYRAEHWAGADMLQQVIIAVLVLCAGGYVVWSFMPMQRRQGLLDALAARGLAVRAAAAHRKRLASPGCGNCAAAGEHEKPKSS